MGITEHHGVRVPASPGLWDTGVAPGKEGGDCPLPPEMEMVHDRQRPCNHSPGGLWPCLAASKWAVLVSEHLQTKFWGLRQGTDLPDPCAMP